MRCVTRWPASTGPIVAGVPSGHTAGAMITLPIGVQVTLHAGRRGLALDRRAGRGLTRNCNVHIHLIGVAGTAMATLAAMLQRRGHRVTGSDAGVYPPMSDFLRAERIEVFEGYDAAHVDADGRPGGGRQRHLAWQRRTRDRAGPPPALLLAARADSRRVPLGSRPDRRRRARTARPPRRAWWRGY